MLKLIEKINLYLLWGLLFYSIRNEITKLVPYDLGYNDIMIDIIIILKQSSI